MSEIIKTQFTVIDFRIGILPNGDLRLSFRSSEAFVFPANPVDNLFNAQQLRQ